MTTEDVPIEEPSFQNQEAARTGTHYTNDYERECSPNSVDGQSQLCQRVSCEHYPLKNGTDVNDCPNIPRSTTMEELEAVPGQEGMKRNISIAEIVLATTNSSSSELLDSESSSVIAIDDLGIALGDENSLSYDTDDVMPSGWYHNAKQDPGFLHPHNNGDRNEDSEKLLRRRRRRSRPRKPERMTDTVEELILPQVSDPDAYMLQRQMTVTQERWNAITMLPSPIFCLYYLLKASWLVIPLATDPTLEAWALSTGSQQVDPVCWPASEWHQLPSEPPLAVLALVLAVIIHSPFSVIYHLKAAHLTAHERTIHWSRRLDQSMIHAASTLVCFATSGSWKYFWVNVWYNADCIYRQFLPSVRPRRNQLRLSIAVALAYLVPLLRRQLWSAFFQLSVLLAVSFVLFTRYPIGGWSHAAFHLVLALTPPLLMQAAVTLESSQPALEQAAICLYQRQLHAQ